MKFLNISSGAGIDVSDHHVRIGKIKHLHEFVLPEGLVKDEKVVDPKKLLMFLKSEISKSSFLGHRLKSTILIPESRVFSSGFVLPKKLKKKQVISDALKKAQKDIPIHFSDSALAVSQGAEEEGGVRTTVYAVQKDVVDGLKQIIDNDNFSIVAMEANSKAIFRIIKRFGKIKGLKKNPKGLIGIVDVGHTWTTISIYTQSGSSVFSRTISYSKHVDKNQAIVLSQETVDRIVETIKSSVVYFKERNLKISSFVLAGVESESEVLKAALQKEGKVVPVTTLAAIIKLKNISIKDVHRYGAAIGAAIRSNHTYKYAYQHNFISK